MENIHTKTLVEGMGNYISLLRRDLEEERERADRYARKWNQSLKREIALEKKLQKLEESNARMQRTIEFIDKEKQETKR